MSEEAGSNVELSDEPVSTEIGSGAVEEAVIEESGLAQEVDGAVVDELAADVEAAVDEGASDEQIQELIETFKLKVNGEDREVTLDWNDKEDIIRRLQMAEAGQSAMQRSAELERNFDSGIQNIMDDPWAALEEMGFDVDAMAEERIQQQIQQLQKTPEQVAQEERDTELESLRQQIKDQEEKRNDAEYQRVEQEASINLDQEITSALSATTDLPKSSYVVKRIADAMLNAMDHGIEDITVAQVIPSVQKEINEEMQGLFSAMPDKVLEQYLGNKTLDRLRQGRLAKMKTPTARSIQDTGRQEPVEQEVKKKVKMSDWLRHGSSLKDL